MGQQPSTPKITSQDKAIFQMKQQRDKLKQYQKKINIVIDRQTRLAKESLIKGDNEKAKFYLRSKKHQDYTIKKTYEQLDNLENLIGTIEFKLIEKDVLYGLTEGNKVLNKLNNEISVDKINEVLDDLEDERLNVEEVSDLLGTTNALTNSEELEVDQEFEALEKEINGSQKLEVALPDAPQGDIEPPSKLPEAPSGEITDSKEGTKESSQQQDPILA